MNCVSLIGTVHEEKGFASVSELLAILERIRPQVIFVEIPPAAFDDFFKVFNRKNLESNAIRKYRKIYQVEIVPVDLPTPEEDFFTNNQYLFEKVEEKSHEYRRLVDLHSTYVRMYGFNYLNSEYCSKLWSNVYEEVLSTLEGIDDSRLFELYELWSKKNDHRDKEMMANVMEYCRKNIFDKGVFLVGAAHRQSIINKAREQSAVDPTRIQWDFPDCVAPRNQSQVNC